MTNDELRAYVAGYQQALARYDQQIGSRWAEIRASLTDSRCTCESVWRGASERPPCTVHEHDREV